MIKNLNGIECHFTITGRLYWCSQWEKVESLVESGVLTRNFYQELFGHTDYYLANHYLLETLTNNL